MKKTYLLLSACLLAVSLLSAQDLQTVTGNGNSTTHQIVVHRTDGSWALNASNGLDADLLLGSTAPGAVTKYAWMQSSFSGRHLILNPDNGANIGIGVLTPEYKLDVSGETNIAENMYVHYSPLDIRLKVGADGLQAYTFANRIPKDLYLNLAGGNVGIGTKPPAAYKLAVDGTIAARRLKITQETPWPDYVFDSSYQLKPLNQVETFIQEHKHLPEIPSAAEIKKEAMDVGDNQVLLLKKIEELTLYIIEQNKRIEVLEKKAAEKR